MYDVIIVGARCAGSPLAMLLAKAGHKVLAVDRSTFPSDIMSTHFLQPDGVQRLQEWGLYDKVMASNCPPIPAARFHVNDVAMPQLPRDEDMPLPICPRRYVLDTILVEAAREAGAEVREGFSVQDILIENGTVLGVRGKNAAGDVVEERARVTVGADGIHSLVARAVKPEEYDTNPAYSCAYYSYFSGVELTDAEIYVGENAGTLAFPTNDGLACIGVGAPRDHFPVFKKDIEGEYYRLLEKASPSFARRVRAGKREERWIGTQDTDNFFRKPYGPGWALCGDAGYHKDPVTGLGIADAFRDAEFLAESLHEALSEDGSWEDAMSAYQQRRDAAAKPMYEMTLAVAQFPTLEEIIAGMQQQAAAAAAAPAG